MTEKLFDLIYLYDRILAVDKDVTDYDQQGWWVYMNRFIGGTCIMSDNEISFKDNEDGIHTLYRNSGDHMNLFKIVASTVEMKGVPLMNLSEPLVIDVPNHIDNNPHDVGIYIDGYIDGHSANQKRYTEEELYNKVCYYFGRGILAQKEGRISELKPTRKMLQYSKVVLQMEFKTIECHNYNGAHVGRDCSCKSGDFRDVFGPYKINNKVVVKKII